MCLVQQYFVFVVRWEKGWTSSLPSHSALQTERRSCVGHLEGSHRCRRQFCCSVIGDNLDALPHALCVTAVFEVVLNFLAVCVHCLYAGFISDNELTVLSGILDLLGVMIVLQIDMI